MKRRTADPLAQLVPVARVAAVGLGAAGGALAAVLAATTPASTQPPSISAAKLVAIPDFPIELKHTTTSATITDRAEITRVAQIINALPIAPTGVFACPADFGNGLELNFESSSGTVLEHVSMHASGCGGTSITINGVKQPDRASGLATIEQIQGILGTHWQLIPTLTG